IKVLPGKFEPLAYLLDLLDKAGQVPQLRRIGLIAVSGAKLVVIVVLDAGRGKVAVKRLEILMSRPRAAGQKEDLDPGIVADALGPDAKLALGRVDGNQLYAARKHIVTL